MKIDRWEAWIENLNGERVQEKHLSGLPRVKELLRWSARQKALLALDAGRSVSSKKRGSCSSSALD